MRHYDTVSKFFDLDETNWNFMLNIAYDRLKKNIKNYSSWITLENNIKKEAENNDDFESIVCFAGIVYPAERSFVNPSPEYEGMCDCELVAHYARLAEKSMNEMLSEKSVFSYDKEMLKILSCLGTDTNDYIRYYDLFLSAVTDELLDITSVEKELIRLSKTDSGINFINDIVSAYAMVCCIKGDTDKGIAIFEDIIQHDEMNLEHYARAAFVFQYCEEYDTELIFLEKALKIAEETEEEDLKTYFNVLINAVLTEKMNKPYENFLSNDLSLKEILDNPEEFENKEKILLDMFLKQHPDIDESQLTGDDPEDGISLEHIKKHADICMKILNDSDYQQRFLDLLKEYREHEAIHILMGEQI